MARLLAYFSDQRTRTFSKTDEAARLPARGQQPAGRVRSRKFNGLGWSRKELICHAGPAAEPPTGRVRIYERASCSLAATVLAVATPVVEYIGQCVAHLPRR